MRKNVKKQIRLTEELLEYINNNFDNSFQFILEAIRGKVEAEKKKSKHDLTFVEIRSKNQYTYSVCNIPDIH